MTSAVLDTPALATRLAQAGAGPAQAAVLREAFDEYNKAVQGHEQSLQEQARALHTLQAAVEKLQQAQARRDEEYASDRQNTVGWVHQLKTLEDNTRRDAVERATKGDVALVHKEVNSLRKDTEVGFAKIEARFAEVKTDAALLRKDMEACNLSIRKDMETQNLSIRKDMETQNLSIRKDMETQNLSIRKDMEAYNLSIRKDLEAYNLSIRKDLEAMQNKLIIQLGGILVVALGAGAAVVKLLG